MSDAAPGARGGADPRGTGGGTGGGDAAGDGARRGDVDAAGRSRYERGRKLVGDVNGARGEQIVDDLGDLGRLIVEFAYGDVYDRPGLSLRDRALITVGVLAAMRGCEPQLDVHLRSAMRVGLTPQELEEVLIHVAPYAGFPAAMNGTARLRAILAEEAAGPGDA